MTTLFPPHPPAPPPRAGSLPHPPAPPRGAGSLTLTLWLLSSCHDAGGPVVRIADAGLGSYEIDAYEFPNQKGQKPSTGMSLDDARAACGSVGKRVCTLAEWRRACRGPDGLRYGYGDAFDAARCFNQGHLPSGHTSLMDPDALVAADGALEACVSPEGVHDLLGNVEEWTLDDWQGRPGSLAGGAWYTYHAYADCSARYSRQADFRLDPSNRVFSAGTRCCRSDGPPTDEAVAADSRAWIADAERRSDAGPYDPSAEVEVVPGAFIDRWEYPNRPGAWPRTVISWDEADQACRDAGKHLCSVRTWEAACAGANGSQPTGCDVEASEPSPAGSHPGCDTPSGVADLVGGVWEWTSDAFDAPVLGRSTTGQMREIRGGSWLTDAVKARCHPQDGYPVVGPGNRLPDLGFRCCRGDDIGTRPAQDAPRPTASCPAGMVAGDGFCIDAYEYPNEAGGIPMGGLSFDAARALCAARDARVCTSEEWQGACTDAGRRRWPYGDAYVAGRCGDDGAARPSATVGAAAPSGAHPDCRTPQGVYDQSGNLWEWVQVGGRGAMAGGSWNLAAGLGQCNVLAEAALGFTSSEVGTRCCADPL